MAETEKNDMKPSPLWAEPNEDEVSVLPYRVDGKRVILNPDDTEEAADEIGVSGVYDHYRREIIPDVFENRLRLAKNSVKLAYSWLKNDILSHKGINRRYVGREERFYDKTGPFITFSIGDDCLKIDVRGVKVECKKEKKGESFKEARKLVDEALAGFEKKEYYVPTAYAERYQYTSDVVLEGFEDETPEYLEYNVEYFPIEGELTKDIIEEMMGEDFDLNEKRGEEKLEGLRQQATTVKGAVALTEPIVYFYGAARNRENNVEYVEQFMVLNDKFLGKILPWQYFSIAEGSERIEYLNLLAIDQAVKTANERQDINVVVQCSPRLLYKDGVYQRLKKAVVTENKNLVLAFDSGFLTALGEKGLTRTRELMADGVKLMLDSMENAGLKGLTEYNADYLRFDGRHYVKEDEYITGYLKMITAYCDVVGLKTCANFVDSGKVCKYMMANGIDIIGGEVVGTPVRLVGAAIKEGKKLPVVPKS